MKLVVIGKLVIFLLLIVFFSNCKKEEQLTLDFVGKWSEIKTSETDSNLVIKQYYIFKENYFEMNWQIYDSIYYNRFFTAFTIKGNLKVKDNIMSFKISDIGARLFDSTGVPATELIFFYNENEKGFNDLLYDLGQAKYYKSEYEISENVIVLKIDNNNDGDYDDESEIGEFNKEY